MHVIHCCSAGITGVGDGIERGHVELQEVSDSSAVDKAARTDFEARP